MTWMGSPEPPFLQAELPLLSQPLFIADAFQALNHHDGPTWDLIPS